MNLKKRDILVVAMQMAMMPTNAVFEVDARSGLGLYDKPKVGGSKVRVRNKKSTSKEKREYKNRHKKGRP